MANGKPFRGDGKIMEFQRHHLRRAGGAGALILALVVSQTHLFGIIFSLPFLVLGAILLMDDLTRPVTRVIDSILGIGSATGERPPIDLRLARSYVARDCLDDALAEYARVMEWHPGISEPYEETMILLARTGANPREIDRVRRRGLRCLRAPEARAAIEAAYRRARETRPDPVTDDTAHRV